MTKLTESQRQYLKEVLRLNPVYQSEEAHLARVELLEAESYDRRSKRQLASREYADRRASARKKIADLREKIWKSSIEELEPEVNLLDFSEFPEYEQDATTFRVILQARERIPELISHKQFDADFLECVKQSLVTGPVQRAEIEERVRASFSNNRLKRDAKGMVGLIKTELPELYELRKDWFDTMFQKKLHFPLT